MKGWMKITLLVVVIFIAVGSFYYLMLSSLLKTTAPPLARESYLELNIYGEVPERSSVDPLVRLFSGEVPSVQGLLQCIRKAKVDPKIRGIILRPYVSGIGWAKVEELRSALLDFKKSEKPIYVYLEVAGNREYYLSVVGDFLFGSPNGNLFINGLLGKSFHFRGTLDKLGIRPDFVVHGKYKNAPEMFTRKDMSDNEREVINAILDDYFPRYVQAISSARNVSEEQIQQAIDHGFFTLKEAYDRKLIDSLLYYNEFKEYMKEKNGHRLRRVSYSRYKKIPFSKLGIEAKETIALVYGIGNIVTGIGDDVPVEGVITSENMAATILKLSKDHDIKAIVMRVNSPGGSGTASDIIWREVMDARQEKPFIISMSDMAASGGYYISMAADSIVAQPSSLVGSIGVFSGKFALDGLYEKLGISKEEIKRGNNADLFSEISTFSEQQQNMLQGYVNNFYRTFVSKAAQNRKMTFQEMDNVAQGRVWTGKQALENGLIDKLGGIQEAIALAKKMAGIPEDVHVRVKIYPRQVSLLQRLLSAGLNSRLSFLDQVLSPGVKNYVKGFLFFRDYEPLTMLPFYPEIK